VLAVAGPEPNDGGSGSVRLYEKVSCCSRLGKGRGGGFSAVAGPRKIRLMRQIPPMRRSWRYVDIVAASSRSMA